MPSIVHSRSSCFSAPPGCMITGFDEKEAVARAKGAARAQHAAPRGLSKAHRRSRAHHREKFGQALSGIDLRQVTGASVIAIRAAPYPRCADTRNGPPRSVSALRGYATPTQAQLRIRAA